MCSTTSQCEYVAGGGPGTVDVCTWPKFHHNAENTGYVDCSGPRLGQVAWVKNVGGHVEASPVVVDNKVIVGTMDGVVYALNTIDGSEIWRFVVPGGFIKSACLVDRDVVYCPTFQDGNVYALALDSGSEIWRTGFAVRSWMSSPSLGGNLIFLASTEGFLTAINKRNGKERWRYNLPEDPCRPTGIRYKSYSSPAFDPDSNTVCFSSYYGAVHSLHTSGKAVWETSLGAPFCGNPYSYGSGVCGSPAIKDQALYIGSLDGNLYALDRTNGQIIWTSNLGNPIRFSSPAIAYDRVYIGGWYGYGAGLFCVDALTGEILWKKPMGRIDCSPAVADGTVYVAGSYDLQAFDAFTGERQWKLRLRDSVPKGAYETIVSSPAIYDGSLYIGAATSEGGKLFKIE
jgi:outer membrane protein assembly factor BamB